MQNTGDDVEFVALAKAVATRILAEWSKFATDHEKGFKIIIHVEPGQTQARIEWPSPVTSVKTK